MPGWGIAPAPRGLRQALGHPAAGTGAGFRRLSGGRLICTFRRLGFRQSSFRHVTRIPRHTTPYAWACAAGFLACYCPLHFSDSGQPSDPEISPLIPARCAGDTTLRLAAQPSHRAMTAMSTPAWSRDIALVCRRVWGVTFFSLIDGQAASAVAACLATSRSTASRESRPPDWVGKQ